MPAPWSVPVRNPFRQGLVLDAGAASGLPAGVLLVQPCFDTTGNSAPNATANADFSQAAETGFCDSRGLQRSRLRQGLYDRRDPEDVNQFGGRMGAVGPLGINFTLNYMYRRNLGADIPGATVAKAQVGAVNNDPVGFIQFDGVPVLSTHTSTDPITNETTATTGYLRIPIEFYYPYVHVMGASANYFEEFTGAVLTAEAAFTHGMPIGTLDPHGNGLNKKDVILGAVNFDRPTWIRWLNERATWLIIGQLNFNYILDHDDIEVDPVTGEFLNGDVGVPNSALIPEQFGSESRIDELKELEMLSLFAFSSFYRGGSFVPTVVWVSDWANAPTMAWFVGFDYLPTNNFIITPQVRIFWTNGHTVDEPWGPGRSTNNDEVQLKFTYQF